MYMMYAMAHWIHLIDRWISLKSICPVLNQLIFGMDQDELVWSG